MNLRKSLFVLILALVAVTLRAMEAEAESLTTETGELKESVPVWQLMEESLPDPNVVLNLRLLPMTQEELNKKLLETASKGHLGDARYWIEKGADVNARDEDGWSPLHKAALGGHRAVVEMLLDRGADINARDSINMTPLAHALNWVYEDVAALLRERGAEQ